MSRFVIRNPEGLLYSGNDVEGIWKPMPTDPSRNYEQLLLIPRFSTDNVLMAIKYEGVDDAQAMLVHADLKDSAAFAGCEVMEVEFDRQTPQGQRTPA